MKLLPCAWVVLSFFALAPTADAQRARAPFARGGVERMQEPQRHRIGRLLRRQIRREFRHELRHALPREQRLELRGELREKLRALLRERRGALRELRQR
jgi:hypothetical protein